MNYSDFWLFQVCGYFMYVAITTVVWGKPFKLLCVHLDASIFAHQRWYRRGNTNKLIGAAILKSGHPYILWAHYSEHIIRSTVLVSFDRLIVLLYASYMQLLCDNWSPEENVKIFMKISKCIRFGRHKGKWWEVSNVVVEKWMTSGTATLRILSNCCSCCTILQQNLYIWGTAEQ